MFDLEFNQIRRALGHFTRVPSWLRTRLSFGRQMYMVRRALGMVQSQLAQKMGTNQSVVARLESDLGDPCLSTMQKVATSLNCELIVRLVPKENMQTYLLRLAQKRAVEIIKMSVASANIEVQRPSSAVIKSETKKLIAAILTSKRSSLWRT